MDVKLIDRGSEGELILSGRLDTKVAPEAEEVFLKMADRYTDLTLNMKDLKYISSAGLRALRGLYMKVRKNGGELSALYVNEYIEEVFEITGFAGFINIRK